MNAAALGWRGQEEGWGEAVREERRHQHQGEPGAEGGRPGDLGGGPNITRNDERRRMMEWHRYQRKASLMLAVDTAEPTSEAKRS